MQLHQAEKINSAGIQLLDEVQIPVNRKPCHIHTKSSESLIPNGTWKLPFDMSPKLCINDNQNELFECHN